MAEWLTRPEEWRDFFGRFERIVLVANSDAVSIDAVASRHGDGALYVFFNKVYKVLATPFRHKSLLVARSSPVGANIVYRREVSEVLGYLPEEHLAGILGLACHVEERFSSAAAFDGRPAGSLQLTDHFANFYPGSHRPTSGFALAL